jgi:DNA-binding YbaB/EbfC family protein
MSFNFSDIGKIGSLMKNMGNIKESMEKARAELDHLFVEAEAGAGDVRVVMSASQKIKSIDIADHLIDISHKTVLQDLIVGAVQLACQRSKDKAQEKMMAISSDLGIPLPGGMGDLF